MNPRRVKRLTSLVVFIISIFSLILPFQVKGFKDTAGHWAEGYIKTLQDHCALSGYVDQQGNNLDLYKPNQNLTRAELVKMLVQCGQIEVSTPSQKPFSDVPVNEWYSSVVTYAKNAGWVSGFSDNTFRPHNPVTREEAMKIMLLTKFQDNQIVATGTNPFKDVSAGSWSERFILFAYGKGYIEGYKDNNGQLTGYFKPQNNLTRAEAAKIIVKLYGWPLSQQQPVIPVGSITSGPHIKNCAIFPADNPWNQDISNFAVHSDSATFLASLGSINLHPDFGSNPDYGIPFNIVNGDHPKAPLVNVDYADESDPGPYPIPDDVKIEAGGDKHVLVIDQDNCKLYELFAAVRGTNGWSAGSAAIFDLTSNTLRPDGWTSADAAGLPIYPGLVKYDEVASGEIQHAIRFTLQKTQKGYIHPATHYAGSENPDLPPMGLRVRLKANFDLSPYEGQALVILKAMKKYGMMLADNGGNWFFQGASDPRWDDEDLDQLKKIPGSAFEAVQTGEIRK
jgi:hypothetical protein